MLRITKTKARSRVEKRYEEKLNDNDFLDGYQFKDMTEVRNNIYKLFEEYDYEILPSIIANIDNNAKNRSEDWALVSMFMPSMEYQNGEHYIEVAESARTSLYESIVSIFLSDISTIIYDNSENKEFEEPNFYLEQFDWFEDMEDEMLNRYREIREVRREITSEELEKEIETMQFQLNTLMSEIDKNSMSLESKKQLLDEVKVNNVENLLLSSIELQHIYYEKYRSLVISEKLSEEQKDELFEEYDETFSNLCMFNAVYLNGNEDDNPSKPDFQSNCNYVNKYEKLCKVYESYIENK